MRSPHSSRSVMRDLFLRLFLQTHSAIDRNNVQAIFVYRYLPPFGMLQLAYQCGTAAFGQRSTQDNTLCTSRPPQSFSPCSALMESSAKLASDLTAAFCSCTDSMLGKKISRLEAPSDDRMFDPFFRWLESTAVSVWIVESPSLFAFPGILAVHTVGLGLLAGLNGALDLRLLGVAPSIPPATFTRLLPVMWFGLWVNVLSGIALVVAYPTKALTNPVFYVKLGLIAAALAILRSILRRVDREEAVPATMTMLAAASLLVWAAVIAAGRFLAYTCTRLTVDSPC